MICSISGEVPTDPVVSPKSGAIFERKNIVNYISTSGTDPINDEPLTEAELVSISTSIPTIVPPKLPSATSIPSLLSTFQNEWDAIALEVFSLRKQLFKAREELSAALYHHDAAVRVAANAIRERDEAKAALEQLSIAIGNGSTLNINGENGSQNNPTSVSSKAPVEDINNARDELFKLHKSQKPTFSVKPDQQVSIISKNSFNYPFKKISTLHFDPSTKDIFIGTTSGTVAKYNLKIPQEQLSKYTPAKTTITSINTVSLEQNSEPILAYKSKFIIDNNKKSFPNNHSAKVSHILVHPSLKNLYITLSEDNTWSLHDSEKETTESLLYSSSKFPNGIISGDIHVDGAIFGIGNDEGKVQILDVADGKVISEIDVGLKIVSHIKFALNGYWLVSLSKDDDSSVIEIIDLRKGVVSHTFEGDNLQGFIIDPSSSVLISYNEENKIQLYRYIKKTKSWSKAIAEYSLKEEDGNITQIELITDAEDESFKENNEIKFFVLTDKSSIIEFELSYN
ncbi:Prp19/Pso4-like-domain-containing protein [Scheffersomyces coipomensis]|uniref:Prp19/Pso4-like-domain-containing protein n=1 Tax=Scheffersomyces coipomensis TaxID=1788519 RepID=UPI00315CB39F